MERILYMTDTCCAVEEDGRLVEYIPANENDRTGRILRGKVSRIMTSVGCAFVDIGDKKCGFLPLSENSKTFCGPPIHSGDRIYVQIRKEATGEKGPFLTRDFSIPGKYLILMPHNRFIGVSARITDTDTRDKLTETGRSLAGNTMGIVLRSAAGTATKDELTAEYTALLEDWKQAEAGMSRGDACPFGASSGFEALTRDYPTAYVVKGEIPDHLNHQLSRMNQRKISLPRGGNIIIDRTEAMTVIDVNTAGDTDGTTRRETILQTNLDACDEIAVQIRLRNISGIVMTDFIDMEEENDRCLVMKQMEKCFSRDRVKTVIHGFTRLGILEMTRKRGRRELSDRNKE